MRFDDRLQTVLNQPAEDRHDAAVRWRQLVDLVARAGANSGSPTVIEAVEAIRNEASRVEEPLRAAAARAVAALPLPLGLLQYFAADSLTVSAPVLAAATLDDYQWQVLHDVADDETRRFIQTVHPELGAEPHVQQPTKAPAAPHFESPAPSEPVPYTPPSLHEVVERIERRRRIRAGKPEDSTGTHAGAEAPAIFRWECGPSGEIAWVDGAPRGALIGRSIARANEGTGDSVDRDVVRAFAMRAPFRDAALTLVGSGSVAGDWKISGVPAFDASDGRFAGYRGVALRETETEAASSEAPQSIPDVLSDPASLRELVHEIKTPLNAIIGFAEIIEGQYLGPADRGYRDRAHEIVRQARLLLTAIDDLDFAAKVHSASGRSRERVDLSALVERESEQLRGIAAKRGIDLDVIRPRFEISAAVQPELADRLLSRLFGVLLNLAERGEQLALSVEAALEGAKISIGRPLALKGIPDVELFEAGGGPGDVGFALRLVRGLARIAGGDLAASRDHFALVFPRG
ncbi:MAG: HAMP domain-containing histidine kinase [Sphingomonas sp.]|nr:HAMP domain-containing histidine kinase [Sphingomonas sp.]